jgi:hypothetical protein
VYRPNGLAKVSQIPIVPLLTGAVDVLIATGSKLDALEPAPQSTVYVKELASEMDPRIVYRPDKIAFTTGAVTLTVGGVKSTLHVWELEIVFTALVAEINSV